MKRGTVVQWLDGLFDDEKLAIEIYEAAKLEGFSRVAVWKASVLLNIKIESLKVYPRRTLWRRQEET